MSLHKVYKWLTFFLVSLILSIGLSSVIVPAWGQATISAQSLYESGKYNEAILIWENTLPNARGAKAISIHVNLGAAYQQAGRFGDAIRHWQRAVEFYRERKDRSSRSLVAELMTDQAQAYNSLGQFKRAQECLEKSIKIAQEIADIRTETVAWGVLGNAYAIAGDHNKAIKVYGRSATLASSLRNPDYIVTALNNLSRLLLLRSQRYIAQAAAASSEGSTQEAKQLSNLAQKDRDAAIEAANAALSQSRANNLATVTTLTNAMQLQGRADYARRAVTILGKLPDSRGKAYALVRLAGIERASQQTKIGNLQQAIAVAQNIGDVRTKSFALNSLGHIYELSGKYIKALQLTQQAQTAAQQVNAFDSLYRAQWQAGRIYKAMGNPQEAISAYRQAIASLQQIRSDVVTASSDLQFDLRDSVEPVYRQLMELLLAGDRGQKNLEEVLQVSDLLKLAELQNFFGDECIEVKSAIFPKEGADKGKTIIQSLIFEKETHVILRLPDASLHDYPVPIAASELRKNIEKLRFDLEDIATNNYLISSQKVYDLLIRPLENELNKVKSSTLIFVNDGVLRNIAMAALHDGKQFLVEKYPIANALSSNLIFPDRDRRPATALIFGLTEEIAPFSPLPNVARETQLVQSILGGKKFLDKDFNFKNLEKQVELEDYSIVHFATHGEFNGTAENTFIQAFDRRIFLKNLESMLRDREQSIDLLALSACSTAAGDNRATLGIAGLAVRNGVRNVLASLWFVNDAETVELIKDFYNQIHKLGKSKAEALRNTQLKVIASGIVHPAAWAGFILLCS